MGAVRIIQVQNRRLGVQIGSTLACDMLLVAFDLRRAVHVAFDQHRGRIATEFECSRVKQRTSGNEFLRLPDVGNDWLNRLLGACGHSRQRHGGTEELYEVAPRNFGQPLGCALGKLAVHLLLELRIVVEFLQAAPEHGSCSYAVARLDLHQLIFLVLAGTNFLAVRLVLIFHFAFFLLSELQSYITA